MPTLEEIRAKLSAAKNKQTQYVNTDNLTFPHWKIEEGQSVVLRFLPDADPTNVYFWRERQQIALPFSGVEGDDSYGPLTIRVPCMDMWKNGTCPIINETRAWWEDKELEDLARTYWKKRSYIMQGFVVDSPLNEDNPPENPIRKFVISPQIFNIIEANINDPEVFSKERNEVPCNYENGFNFTINKTMKGKFADYTTSKFSRNPSPLTSEQREEIEKYGLFNLNDWELSMPSADAIVAIQEMFHASVNGEKYDPQRWGQYYRPYGMQAPASSGKSAPVAKPEPQTASVAPEVSVSQSPEPVSQAVEAPASVADSGGETSGSSAADILAKIRARSAE